MKIKVLLLASLLVVVLAGVAYVGQQTDTPGSKMTAAAEKFLGSLTADQKKKISFDFDSKERTRWFFTPQQDKEKKSTRKGVPLQDMTAEQKQLVLSLLATGTSAKGKEK